jgi:hypothetical protein
MRLVKVNAPEGRGKDVMRIAFSADIHKVSLFKVERHQSDGRIETRDVIDIEASTSQAKHFVDQLLQSDFFDRKEFSLTLREPRSIVSEQDFRQLTKPLVEPVTDVFEELFQFSHVTLGFACRGFIAGCLLAYGMIQQQILLMIAGLLFLPLLPLLLSVSFGTWINQWKLVIQGFASFGMVITLLVAGGALVASLSHPPLRYNEFNPILVSFIISAVVGIAAGISTIDDVGRRELIGLAASSQLAIIPAWIGISFVFGFSAADSRVEILERVGSFFLNTITIIVSAILVYVLTCGVKTSIQKTDSKSAKKTNAAKVLSERAELH